MSWDFFCGLQDAVFISGHQDPNSVQTIIRKCKVLSYKEFTERDEDEDEGELEIFYLAGFYNHITKKIKFASDLNI